MEQGPHVVNARHAVEALRDGSIEGWRAASGERLVLGTKLVDLGVSEQYTIVALALEDPPGTAVLSRAWRLYDADPDWKPTEAFSEILLRYGVDFRLGASETTGFVAQLLVELTEDGEVPVVISDDAFPDNTPRESRALAVNYVLADPGPPADLLWVFMIDESTYAEDVRRRRTRRASSN